MTFHGEIEIFSISKRMPLAEIRAARDPIERSGSLHLPQKSLGIRLDLCVHGVTLWTVTRTVTH